MLNNNQRYIKIKCVKYLPRDEDEARKPFSGSDFDELANKGKCGIITRVLKIFNGEYKTVKCSSKLLNQIHTLIDDPLDKDILVISGGNAYILAHMIIDKGSQADWMEVNIIGEQIVNKTKELDNYHKELKKLVIPEPPANLADTITLNLTFENGTIISRRFYKYQNIGYVLKYCILKLEVVNKEIRLRSPIGAIYNNDNVDLSLNEVSEYTTNFQVEVIDKQS